MEQSLCEAAITGDIDSLHDIVEKDPKILHRVAAGCLSSAAASPLHVATSSGQTDFVKALLNLTPEIKLRLTEVLDSQLRSALHLASAQGHDEIVQTFFFFLIRNLVKANPDMCLVHDREGKKPSPCGGRERQHQCLESVGGSMPTSRVRVDQKETILHLCVKHNQQESLKELLETIQGEELVNAKDDDGNTILHLAILDERFEITRHLLSKQTINVNVENSSGHTAVDILIRVEAKLLKCCSKDMPELDRIKDLLRQAKARPAKDLVGGQWLKKKKNSLMVVASLITTMAFQAGVSPPGGVWQDNKDEHRAGEAVMAYNYQDSYHFFLRFNTISFVASLSTILLLISGLKFRNKATLWFLTVSMWSAITSLAITYAFSNVVITPKGGRRPLTNTILIAVIVWSSVLTLLLLKHTYQLVALFVEEQRNIKTASKRTKECRRIMEERDRV